MSKRRNINIFENQFKITTQKTKGHVIELRKINTSNKKNKKKQ